MVVETKGADGPNTTRSLTTTIIEGFLEPECEASPPPEVPAVEDVIEAKAAPEPEPIVEEPKVDLTATMVQGSTAEPPPQEKEEPAPKVDLTATIVHGSTEEPKVVAPEPEPIVALPPPNFAKTLAFGSKLDELPQSAPIPIPTPVVEGRDRLAEIRERKEARERLREKRAAAQAAAAKVAPSTDPDEISVPPASDLANDPAHELGHEDEKFFSEGDLSKHLLSAEAHAELEDELLPEKARRKAHPQVIRRREKLAGYVKIAVATAAVVCLAAIGSSAVHSTRKSSSEPAVAAAAMVAPEPVAPVTAKAQETATAPAPETAAPAATPAPEPPAAVAPTPDPAAAAAVPEAKAEEIAGDAKEELKKSRSALEHRKIPEAIEAGERSVALDPTDGEAWLILGASYQEKGNLADARRCYSACIKQGKTGPRSECQKMLR